MFCSNAILHYDRYKYLCLKTAYKSNNQEALEKIISFKIISFLVTFLIFVIDSEVRKCQNSVVVFRNKVIIFLKEDDILWKLIPLIISFGFTFNVLRFAIKEKMREQRTNEQQNMNGENNLGLQVEIQTLSQRVSNNEMYPQDILSKKNYLLLFFS